MKDTAMDRVDRFQFSAFDWRVAKNESNLAKHKIDFREAAAALLQPHAEVPSERNGEARIKALCKVGDRIVVVIFVGRDEVCNIISARPARRDERRAYGALFGG